MNLDKHLAEKIKGALLIGGASRRMGHPKSLLPSGQTTLGDHLLCLLQEATATSPVIVGEGSVGPQTDRFTRVADLVKGAGPLSALLGLFQHDPKATWLVLATDLPAMNAPALAWLISMAGESSAPVCRPKFPNRPFGEPLSAIYRPGAETHLIMAWERGRRAPHRAIPSDLMYEPIIPDAHLIAFTGANTPDELSDLKKKSPTSMN